MENFTKPSDGVLYSSIFPERLSKGDLKKLEIIKAAIDLSAKQSLAELSYDDLAKAIGSTRSHIVYHFKEHQDLFVAVVKYMMAEGHAFTFERMKVGTSAAEKLQAYLDGYYDFFWQSPNYKSVMLFFYYAAAYEGPFRELQTQIRQLANSRIAEILRLLVDENKLKGFKDLTILANQIQFMVLGGLILNLSTGAPYSSETAEKAKSEICSATLALLKIKK